MKNIPFFQLIFPLIKSNIKCKQSNSKSIIKYQEESCLQKIKQPVHVDSKINIYRLIFYTAAFAIFKHPTLNVPMYIYLFCSLFRNRIYSVVIFLTFILKITIMPFDIQRLNFPCINQPIKYIPGFSAVF